MTRRRTLCSLLAVAALVFAALPIPVLAHSDLANTDNFLVHSNNVLLSWLTSFLARYGTAPLPGTPGERRGVIVQPSGIGLIVEPNGGVIPDPNEEFQPGQSGEAN